MRNSVDLKIKDEDWAPTGDESDPTSRLLISVYVNGVPHHLEAYAVKDDEEGYQTAVDSAYDSNLHGMFQVSEAEGRWETLEISGREYVLAMTPFC